MKSYKSITERVYIYGKKYKLYTMTTFAYTILYVQNVVKTVEFYEKAFGLERKFIAPENSYAELKSGNTTLSFASIAFANSNFSSGFVESSLKAKPFGMEIGFTTENVAETIENAVSAGGTLVQEAKSKPWGQIVGYIRDLDGFLVEICTPMED